MWSATWTSFMPLPVMAQIIERANMDPWAAINETINKIGSEAVFSPVSVTSHTVRVRTVHSKDAATLRDTRDWMMHRPAMRDGTTGFAWQKWRLSGRMAHLLRKSEDFAMQKGLSSREHAWHTGFQETCGEYKDAMRRVAERAGGTLTCASHLGRIRKIPGLYDFAKEAISKLRGRGNVIIESFPHDSFTTALKNALLYAFNSVLVPGLSGHNNGSEGVVRTYLVPDRNRYTFVNEKAAYNQSILKTFAATCRKNGASMYRAAINVAKDPRWNVFNSGIPPPMLLDAGPEGDGE